MPISITFQSFINKLFSSDDDLREGLIKRALRSFCRKPLIFFNYSFELRKEPQMKETTRRYIKEYYKNEIYKLEKLLDKDLSHWR